jgi:hypothetical protein
MSADNSTPAPGREPFSTPEEIFEALTGEPARPAIPPELLSAAPPIPGELLTAPRHVGEPLTRAYEATARALDLAMRFRAAPPRARTRFEEILRELTALVRQATESVASVEAALTLAAPLDARSAHQEALVTASAIVHAGGQVALRIVDFRKAVEHLQRVPAVDVRALLDRMRRETCLAWHAHQRLSPPVVTTLAYASGQEHVETAASAPGELPPLLSAGDLARVLQQPVARVESFLRRHRVTYPDCCTEVEEGGRRKNEPRYLYRTADVWPVLQQQLSKWRRLTDG